MGLHPQHRRQAGVAGTPAGGWWQAAGLLWATINLAAAAVGVFPAAISPAAREAGPVLPALKALAVGQAGFLLLVYPLVLARRTSQRGRADWSLRLGEMALWLIVAAPFAAACAYFSDAGVTDAVRAELMMVAAFPAAWGLAALANKGRKGASACALAAVLLVLGGAAAAYLAAEFWPGGCPGWLWEGCPILLAWTCAAGRHGSWVPLPLWGLLWWPAGGVLLAVFCRRT
jgi:hypothetical protein